MVENQHKLELADFLKQKRKSLDLADFGIPRNTRRRTSGLRREEVAELAGISVTWYTWLEQGRDIQVSTTVLSHLAQALRLDPVERNHLYTLAGKTTIAAQCSANTEVVRESLRNMIASLDPNPACILGRRWDVLIWNDAACALLGDFDRIPPQERNTIWRLFQNENLRHRIVNWDKTAQQVLAQFRMSYDCYAGDSSFADLVEKLSAASPEFRRLWSSHNILGPDDGYREVNHPKCGKMAFQHGTFRVFDSPDLKLFLYTPLQKFDTKEKMKEILKNFRHRNHRFTG